MISASVDLGERFANSSNERTEPMERIASKWSPDEVFRDGRGRRPFLGPFDAPVVSEVASTR